MYAGGDDITMTTYTNMSTWKDRMSNTYSRLQCWYTTIQRLLFNYTDLIKQAIIQLNIISLSWDQAVHVPQWASQANPTLCVLYIMQISHISMRLCIISLHNKHITVCMIQASLLWWVSTPPIGGVYNDCMSSQSPRCQHHCSHSQIACKR